jgi:hypothetical protein
VELATTMKCDLSADDYFRKIKSLVDEMAVADAPLRDDEIVAYLLAGLSLDYDPFVTSMATKRDPLTLDGVYADLVSYEAQQLQHQAEARLHVGNTANNVGHGGTLPHGGHDGPPCGPSHGSSRGGIPAGHGRGVSHGRNNSN